MSLNKFKTSLLVTLSVGIAIATAAVSGAMADPLLASPTATNGILGAIGPNANFSTDGATILFTSDLLINSAPGYMAGTSTPVTASENGSFILSNFSLANVPISNVTTGINRLGVGLLVPGDYNIYAVFTISGTGTWISATQYALTSVTSDSIILYANPSTQPIGNQPNFVAGSTQATQSSSGITIPAGDFILGSAGITGITGNGNGATYLGAGTSAGAGGTANGTALGATLAVLPAAGTAGPGGFFNNLAMGLLLSITSTDSSNGLEVTGFDTVSGGFGSSGDTCSSLTGCTDLQTKFGIANGTLTLEVNAVPEPASLSLLGGGLLALAGFARRRRSRQSAKA